jgi:LacI family transcriptional regulator
VRGAIAWINAWGSPDKLRAHPEVDGYWRGAGDAAMNCGYRLEEFRLGTEFSPARLHQVLETRNIRGILLPPHGRFAKWRDFPWESYAIVTLGHVAEGPAGHRVAPATAANLVLALRRIRERGYRRIGCLADSSVLRCAGHALENSMPEARTVPLLDLAGVPESKVASRVGGWIRCHRLDAVLADDPATARRVEEAGFSVPGDVAVATLARAGDAGIDPGSEEIGRTGIQMLDAMMRER